MDQIVIRPATVDDLATLFVFEQGVIAAERPFDSTLKAGLIHYYDLEYMIIAPHIQLLVATLGDILIGSGYARIETAKEYSAHDQHAYLGFMYTDPAYRGRGVNKQIIDSLARWASARGITELRLDVYTENLSAISAYQKTGFTRLMVQMRKGI